MLLGALAIGVMIASSASLLGVTLVLKKYSLLGDGLAHIGFGSMAVASLCDKLLDGALGDYSLLVSVPIVVASAILIMKIGDKTDSGDSAIALVSVSALALGYIIYKYSTGQASDVCSGMFGSADILTPSTADYVISAVLSVAVITLFLIFYNRIFALSFDEDFARSRGMKVETHRTLIAVLVALVIVLGMKMLGTVMISGLIVFPALSAMKIFKSFKGVTIAALVISVLCTAIGVTTAFMVSNMPIGPCVVMVNLLVYIVVSIVKKKSKGAF